MSGVGKRGLVIAIVAGVLAAGCGGGSSAVTAPNTPKQLAADKVVAKGAVLTANDLPAGYAGTPHDNSSPNTPAETAAEKKFATCSGLPKRFIDSKDDGQPNADSPDFKKGEIGQGVATEIDSSVELDRSSNDIKDPLSRLTGTGAANCFKPFFEAVLKESLAGTPGVTLAPLAVTVLDLGSLGDQRSGFQGRSSVTGPGGSISFEFNFYFVRTGRAIVSMVAIGFGGPIDQALAKSLLTTMVGRLKAAT